MFLSAYTGKIKISLNVLDQRMLLARPEVEVGAPLGGSEKNVLQGGCKCFGDSLKNKSGTPAE